MKILLTGASSYISKYIANRLLEDGYIIEAISRTNPEINHINYKWIKIDLIKDKIDSKNIDFIIHMAAQAKLNKNASEYFNANILITKRVAEFAKLIKPKCIIYTSSIKVYGEIHDQVVSEASSLINPELYGISKYYGEKLLEEVAPTISLRMPGVISNGSYGWIDSIYDKLIHNKSIDIVNSEYNHLVHSYDIYRCFKYFMDNYKEFQTNQFNICASEISSSKDVVNLLKELTNSDSLINSVEQNKHRYILSNRKLSDYYKPMTIIKSLELFVDEMRGK